MAQEHAHLLEERYYHCRESLGVTAILGSGIAAMSGLSLANIGLALVGAGTLIANNIIARMRQQPKTALALNLLNEAQNSAGTTEPASKTIQTNTPKRNLSPEALRDLSRGKEEHVQLLASYLGTTPSTVRLGLKHCGIERTLKTLGSSGSLPTPAE